MKDRSWNSLLPLVVLLVPVFLVLTYLPIWMSDFFLVDDATLVKNALYTSPWTWGKLLAVFQLGRHVDYCPLRDISYFVDVFVMGGEPWAFRIHQMLLFFGLLVTLFQICRGLGATSTHSLIALTAYAVMPIHFEMLAWISSRKDLLAILLSSLSVLLFFNYLKKARLRRLFLSGLFFVVGTLTKTSLSTLPFFLIFILLTRLWKCADRKVWIFSFVLALYGLAWTLFQTWFYTNVNDMRGAEPFGWRVRGALITLGKYAAGFFDPKSVSIELRTLGDWMDFNAPYQWLGIAVLALVLSVAALALVYQRKSTLTFLVLLVAVYLPTSALLFPHRIFYAVRYIEPAIATLTIACAVHLSRMKMNAGKVASALGVFLSLFWAYQTYAGGKYWEDSVAFWARELRVESAGLTGRENLLVALDTEVHVHHLSLESDQSKLLGKINSQLRLECGLDGTATPQYPESCVYTQDIYLRRALRENNRSEALRIAQLELNTLSAIDPKFSFVSRELRSRTVFLLELMGRDQTRAAKAFREELKWPYTTDIRTILFWLATCLSEDPSAARDVYRQGLQHFSVTRPEMLTTVNRLKSVALESHQIKIEACIKDLK